MSDPEDENYVFYGTALQEEVESRAGQHSKALQDPSLTKSLPVWKQVRPLGLACIICKSGSSICNGSRLRPAQGGQCLRVTAASSTDGMLKDHGFP